MGHPGQSGTLGGAEYARVTTARFTADDDDIFMRSMINNYAIEKNSGGDGPPVASGKFVMNASTIEPLLPKFSAHIKDYVLLPSKPILQPISIRHGDISMSTEPEKLRLSSHHNS